MKTLKTLYSRSQLEALLKQCPTLVVTGTPTKIIARDAGKTALKACMEVNDKSPNTEEWYVQIALGFFENVEYYNS